MSHERVSMDVNAHEILEQEQKSSSTRPKVELPLCTSDPSRKGCFLTETERAVVIREFDNHVNGAARLYMAAIASVKMDTLLEKEEDMSWFATILFDVTSMFLVGQIAKFAARLAGPTVVGLSEKFQDAITEENIHKATEKVTSPIKDGAKQSLKGPSERVDDKKRDATAYLNTLYNAANMSFTTFANELPRSATDEELFRARDAFAPAKQDFGRFAAEIRKKVDIYLKSGLKTIGRKHAKRDTETTLPDGKKLKGSVDVVRDTRVAWHVYKSGFPTQLVYEYMDGERQPWVIDQWEGKQDRIKAELGHGMKFGPKHALDGVQTGDIVPKEYAETAIARHEEAWGEKPRTVVIDDTNWDPTRIHIADALKIGNHQ